MKTARFNGPEDIEIATLRHPPFDQARSRSTLLVRDL